MSKQVESINYQDTLHPQVGGKDTLLGQTALLLISLTYGYILLKWWYNSSQNIT